MANKTENGQKKNHMKKFLYNFEQTRLWCDKIGRGHIKKGW